MYSIYTINFPNINDPLLIIIPSPELQDKGEKKNKNFIDIQIIRHTPYQLIKLN